MEPLTPEQLAALAKLREPFPDNLVNYKPVATCDADEYKALPKAVCKTCGGYHATSRTNHLAYVGHAALTSRLLEVDPTWDWEPLALDAQGLPQFDAFNGLWIKLTLCGVTRLGYGQAKVNKWAEVGSREKEVIGDALRNAAMRFGAALEFWHKGNLNAPEPTDNEPEEKPKTTVPLPKSKKSKAVEPSTASVTTTDAVAAETGEIKWTLAKLNALVEVTPADVLVEAGCGELDPDTLEGLTKQQFASIKSALKGVH